MHARPRDPKQRALWFAAATHHAVSVIAQRRMKARALTRRQLADELGTTQEYLGRVFRGEVALSAQVLGGLESVLGPLTFVVSESPIPAPTTRTTGALAQAIKRAKAAEQRNQERQRRQSQ